VEVVLGAYDNQRSMIRYGAAVSELQIVFDTSTPDILHCNDLRSFWLEWDDSGFVAVGMGPSVSEQRFMQWTKADRRFYNSIGLTNENGGTAMWQVNENTGQSTRCTSCYLNYGMGLLQD
jgi:hypothetical protein